MSLSHFHHPFDVVRHPTLEPEVKRAILARWASDKSAVEDNPCLRQPPSAASAVPIDEVMAALRSLDSAETGSDDRH